MKVVLRLALFVALPILEIYLIVQVGQAIGAVPTILLLIAGSGLGMWVIKHEGRRAWLALNDTVTSGELPGRELTDAATVLIGGVLLMVPGFLTDFAGVFCVLPFTRPLARGLLALLVSRRVVRYAAVRYSPSTRDGVHQIYRDHPSDQG